MAENKGPAQYVNCAAANPGADAGMYDASEQYKLSTVFKRTSRWRCPTLPTFTIYQDRPLKRWHQSIIFSSNISIACVCPAVFCSVLSK